MRQPYSWHLGQRIYQTCQNDSVLDKLKLTSHYLKRDVYVFNNGYSLGIEVENLFLSLYGINMARVVTVSMTVQIPGTFYLN